MIDDWKSSTLSFFLIVWLAEGRCFVKWPQHEGQQMLKFRSQHCWRNHFENNNWELICRNWIVLCPGHGSVTGCEAMCSCWRELAGNVGCTQYVDGVEKYWGGLFTRCFKSLTLFISHHQNKVTSSFSRTGLLSLMSATLIRIVPVPVLPPGAPPISVPLIVRL